MQAPGSELAIADYQSISFKNMKLRMVAGGQNNVTITSAKKVQNKEKGGGRFRNSFYFTF